MSENIQSRIEIHKFGKPAPAVTVFRDQISIAVSQEVHESIKETVPEFAKVGKTIELVETSRSIQTFKMTYDRIFKRFQERVVNEYGKMRGVYMSEYQSNFD